MKKFLYLLVMLCVTIASYAQITPVNIGKSPDDKTGDPLRTAFDKLNKNDAYLDDRVDSVKNGPNKVGVVHTDEFANNVNSLVSTIDVDGPGTVTLTNGAASVVGNGTSFTDATPRGISFWFSFHVTDSAGVNYYVFLSSVTNATTATISYVYSDVQLKTAGSVASTTFPGVTGTYTYKVVRNKAKGNFSGAYGNNNYAENFSTSFGGLTTAAGQTSFAIGAQTLALGSRSFAGGWGSFSSNLDKRVLASGQAAFNFSQNFSTQTVGHGALALGSAILGGKDHNIPSNATYSAVLGGDGIKVGSGVTNTVHFPKVRFGLGTGASLVTDNTNNNILVRDATTGEVKLRSASTIGGFASTTLNSNVVINATAQSYGVKFGDTSIGDNLDHFEVAANNDINFLSDFGSVNVAGSPILTNATGWRINNQTNITSATDVFGGGTSTLRFGSNISGNRFASLQLHANTLSLSSYSSGGISISSNDPLGNVTMFSNNRFYITGDNGAEYMSEPSVYNALSLIPKQFADNNYFKKEGTTTLTDNQTTQVNVPANTTLAFQTTPGGSSTIGLASSTFEGQIYLKENTSTQTIAEFNTHNGATAIRLVSDPGDVYVNGVGSLFVEVAGVQRFRIDVNGNVSFPNAPTSCAGKPSGTMWNDAGTLKVCP